MGVAARAVASAVFWLVLPIGARWRPVLTLNCAFGRWPETAPVSGPDFVSKSGASGGSLFGKMRERGWF